MLLLLPTTRALSTTSSSSSSNTIINHLLHRPYLTQSYSALRHGQSLANVAKIISSDPQISTVQHGLSDVGTNQATVAGEKFANSYHRHLLASSSDSISNSSSRDNNTSKYYEGVAIFSSDFTRAKETASLLAQSLVDSEIPIYNNDIVLETRLRERFFGELNGGSDDQYQNVWDVDCMDPNHNKFGVESANDVLERTTKLITELDDMLSLDGGGGGGGDEKKRWKVVLVAHGDVLQIMQTGFLKHEDASRHRSLEHLETATIRELTLL